jgi:hypothetical protein
VLSLCAVATPRALTEPLTSGGTTGDLNDRGRNYYFLYERRHDKLCVYTHQVVIKYFSSSRYIFIVVVFNLKLSKVAVINFLLQKLTRQKSCVCVLDAYARGIFLKNYF